jgi:hypothetical protein
MAQEPIVECEGIWLGFRGPHVLWSDDREELVELLQSEMILIDTDKYQLMCHAVSGMEIIVPSFCSDWTNRQCGFVLEMIKKAMRKASMQ